MFRNENYNLSKEEILDCLSSTDDKQKELHYHSRKIRDYHCKNKVYVRGVLDISNFCKCNCSFCGNAAYVKNIDRYRLSYKDIINQIDFAKSRGIDVVHLASGKDSNFDFEIIIDSVKYMNKMDIYPELALGRLTEQQYLKLYETGARRYILKFETSDEGVFNEVKTCNSTLDDIINTLKMLNDIGFNVGSGNIIGLPGQSLESIAEDILLLKKMNVSMVSTSVFTPNKESKLSEEKKGDANIALNYLSLIRTVFPNKNLSIPSNSTLGADGKIKALEISANELSFNITPIEFSQKYSIYSGKDRVKDSMEIIRENIKKAGMKQSTLRRTIYE